MGQGRKASRQQAVAQHQRHKRRRMTWFIVAPVVLAALVAVLALTSQPGYSGFDVIGTRPALVQVFLPG
jgi:hypothetical protein